MACREGGLAKMRDVEIADCGNSGVVSIDQGSKAVVRGGRIVGSKEGHGVLCQDGGQVELMDVAIADCKKCGVISSGRRSKVVMQGGCTTGSKEYHGVSCQKGGHAEVHGVDIHDCKQCGLCCDSISSLTHSGCTVSGCGIGSRCNC